MKSWGSKMRIEEVKEIVKDHLVRKGCSVDQADDLIASYAGSIYEDWDNGCNCEEIAQSILDSEEYN